MKKCLTWMLTSLMIFCIIVSAVAEKSVNINPNEEYTVESVAVIGDTLYCIMGDDIVSVVPGKNPEVFLCLDDNDSIGRNRNFLYQLLLIEKEETLYLLCSTSGELYDISDGNLKKIITLDITSMGEEWENEGKYIGFDYPVIIDNDLYLLYTEPDNYRLQTIVRFSLKTGEREEINSGHHNPQELIRYKDQLLVLNENFDSLLLVDTKTKRITDQRVFVVKDDGFAFVYDEIDDQFYYTTGTTVISEQNGKSETVDRLYYTEEDSFLRAALWNDKYIIYYEKGLFICDKNDIGESQTVLRLYASEGVYLPEGVFSEFMNHHPDILIERNYIKDENFSEMLLQILMDKNSGVDLFLLNNKKIDFEKIISKGYAAPLQNEDINKDAANLYPQIREYLSSNNVLYGYPAMLLPHCWSAHTNSMKTGEIQKLPTTVNEYLDMMTEWFDKDENSNMFSDSWLNSPEYDLYYLVRKYVLAEIVNNGVVNFNSQAFRETMEKYALIMQKMKESDREQEKDGSILFMMNDYMPIVNVSYAYNAANQRTPFIPPLFNAGQKPVMDGELGYFFVYSQSEHKEEAEHFLNFFGGMLQEPDTYLLYPDIDAPQESYEYLYETEEIQWEIEGINAAIADIFADGENPEEQMMTIDDVDVSYTEYLAELEKEKESLESIRWAYSAEEIQNYKNVAEYLYLDQGAFVEKVSWSVVNILIDYINGKRPLDDVLLASDRVVDMIYKEGL